MNCCQCQGIESCFDRQLVVKELARYRRKGAAKTTRMLLDGLRAEGVEGATLLDIGGGLGAIAHELLAAGATRASYVDASSAYLEAAREETERRGYAGQVSYYHGDFVALAAQLPPADVVTLDRVVCCYHDMQALVHESAARARRLYGLVYPRDTWWVKLGLALLNLGLRLGRSPFRVFVHPSQAVEAILHACGLQRRFYRQTAIWQVAVYAPA
jgi:magnesium-protoporphyrin O-methyltransferase